MAGKSDMKPGKNEYYVNPKELVRGIDKRVEAALVALGKANKGKYAEVTGVSASTLSRPNVK